MIIPAENVKTTFPPGFRRMLGGRREYVDQEGYLFTVQYSSQLVQVAGDSGGFPGGLGSPAQFLQQEANLLLGIPPEGQSRFWGDAAQTRVIVVMCERFRSPGQW